MQRYNKYKTNLKEGTLSSITLVSGWVSAFRWPYRPCPIPCPILGLILDLVLPSQLVLYNYFYHRISTWTEDRKFSDSIFWKNSYLHICNWSKVYYYFYCNWVLGKKFQKRIYIRNHNWTSLHIIKLHHISKSHRHEIPPTSEIPPGLGNNQWDCAYLGDSQQTWSHGTNNSIWARSLVVEWPSHVFEISSLKVVPQKWWSNSLHAYSV